MINGKTPAIPPNAKAKIYFNAAPKFFFITNEITKYDEKMNQTENIFGRNIKESPNVKPNANACHIEKFLDMRIEIEIYNAMLINGNAYSSVRFPPSKHE